MNDHSTLTATANKALIDPESSRRITSLRFILSMLVVFIHNNLNLKIFADWEEAGSPVPVFAQSLPGEWIQFLISNALASCAVPLFFMFSAYLFFKKPGTYSEMLRKKTKGLVIPYVVWTLLNILLISLIKFIVARLSPSLLGKPEAIPVVSYGFSDWIKAFTGICYDRYNHPYVAQFWYIRDLFILFLISPLLRIIYKKFPKSSLILCIFLFISGIAPSALSSEKSALLFFTLGYFWAEKDFSPFSFADSIGWCELIVMFIFSALGDKLFFNGNSVAGSLMVFFSCLFFLKLSGLIARNPGSFSLAEKFAPFSFFLFAIHMPLLLNCVQRVWLRLFPMKNGFFCLFEYFGVNITIILIGTITAAILRKVCPPLFSLLNGGRKGASKNCNF